MNFSSEYLFKLWFYISSDECLACSTIGDWRPTESKEQKIKLVRRTNNIILLSTISTLECICIVNIIYKSLAALTLL